jgi:hypothetical protein
MKNTDNPYYPQTMHEAYLGIAADSYLNYTKLNNKQKYYSPKSLDSIGMYLFLARQMREQLTISIIFSALCLEAFINHYAISNFDRPYFDKYIESLSISKKCMIVPKLITGNSFKTGSQEMTKLKNLFDMRNKLVHFKTILHKSYEDYKKIDTEETRIVSASKAKNALLTVSSVVKGLKKLDPKVDSTWIFNALQQLVETSNIRIIL